MKILVGTWNHWMPIAILWNGTKMGNIHRIRERNYYITKVGKIRAYCVKHV